MSSFKIKIRNLKSEETEITVSLDDTISKVKQKYINAVGKSLSVQLKAGGKTLNDKSTIKDYEIEENDVLTSNERSLGGSIYSNLIKID